MTGVTLHGVVSPEKLHNINTKRRKGEKPQGRPSS